MWFLPPCFSLSDYRSKILEKRIYTNYQAACIPKGVWCYLKILAWFLSRKSTTTKLLDCLDDWTLELSEHHKLDVMYIDLEKAFDPLSHEKLLYKMSKIGLGGNLHKWFSSFLIERIEIWSSTVVSSIPQGTIHGALLFILLINNVSYVLLHSKIQLYADDLKDIRGCYYHRTVPSFWAWYSCSQWMIGFNRVSCELI